ncbi:hypothetical protein IJI70_00935 [Candidatus Saccharibacteria bacterium]|nr:hypothetical protein [Candidatus Saccharibacteria bacterium]
MLKKKITIIILNLIALFAIFTPSNAHASNMFSLSPMNQMVTLTPGETFYGNFNVVNPGTSTNDFYYTLEVKPFTTSNNGEISTESNGDYTLMADWIELFSTDDIIAPNEVKEIRFAIHVPDDAPAGGQYATIVVRSGEYRIDNSNVDLREAYESGHLIYADVAGETVRKGSVNDVNVPSFLFSGNISGSALIKNEGNVHSQATSTLQVFPLFSSEEVFTNEEDPKKSWIMPGNTTLTTTEWTETPSIGIFHVIYNVEFEGVSEKVDKMVIVCPLWLLFVILVIIFLIIFKILSGKKEKK